MSTHLKDWRKGAKLPAEDVAARLKVTLAMWSRWENGRRQIPATRVVEVADMTGIAPHLLRPDVFPTPLPEPEGEKTA